MSVHFEYEERDPQDVNVGDWVLFLPLGLAEQAYENPPMVKVVSVRREEQKFVIDTSNGLLVIEPGQKVQVIL